jgi:hypothetical protein
MEISISTPPTTNIPVTSTPVPNKPVTNHQTANFGEIPELFQTHLPDSYWPLTAVALLLVYLSPKVCERLYLCALKLQFA